MELKIIARMRSLFPNKTGIPRQSNLIPELRSTVVFEPEFRNPEALRGLEGFSHLWLIWGFSENAREDWSPTVRPPRLGGNTRMGVFATRAPFRPNPLGLSSVMLDAIEKTPHDGTVLQVSGADLMDGTPIYDIKPYISFTDSHPEARNGFAEQAKAHALDVTVPPNLAKNLAPEHLKALISILAQDPRPAYQNDSERIYGFPFAGAEIRFKVSGNALEVVDIV